MRTAIAVCRLFPELSASNQAYLQALEAAGAEVDCLAWNVAPIAAFHDYDVVVLRQTWDYQVDAAGFAAWLSRLAMDGVALHNPAPVAIWNNDKRTITELAEAGFDVPATADLDRHEIGEAASRIGGETFVLKPAYGGGGVGVRLAKRQELSAALEEAQTEAPGRPFMLQEFLPEIDQGEWSLSFSGGAFSHAVVKIPRRGEFRVNNRFSPESRLAEPPAGVAESAAAILASIPAPLLYARVDGVLRAGRFICTELELCDPDLHLHMAPGSAERLAAATLAAAD